MKANFKDLTEHYIFKNNPDDSDMYWGAECAYLLTNQKQFKKISKIHNIHQNSDRWVSDTKYPTFYPCVVEYYSHFEGGMQYLVVHPYVEDSPYLNMEYSPAPIPRTFPAREPIKDKQTIIQENYLDVIDALGNIGFKVEYGENYSLLLSLYSHKIELDVTLRGIYLIVKQRFFSQYADAIHENFYGKIATEQLLFGIESFIKYHDNKALQYESNPYDSSVKQYKSLSKIFKEEFGIDETVRNLKLELFYPTTS